MASWVVVFLLCSPDLPHASWPQGQRSQGPGLGPATHPLPVLWAHPPVALCILATPEPQHPDPPGPSLSPTHGGSLFYFRTRLSQDPGGPPRPGPSRHLPPLTGCTAVAASTQPQASLPCPETTMSLSVPSPLTAAGLMWAAPPRCLPLMQFQLEEPASHAPTPGPWHFRSPAQQLPDLLMCTFLAKHHFLRALP